MNLMVKIRKPAIITAIVDVIKAVSWVSLGRLAMNKELLSKSEKRRQLNKIEYMAKAIEKALAIK